MRVASTSIPANLVTQLQDLQRQQVELQRQASSGRRIEKPSEDPVAAAEVLRTHTSRHRIGQYAQNQDRAEALLRVGSDALKGLHDLTVRGREIAARAGGVATPGEMTTWSGELEQLIEQALATAEQQHQGKYLFGGAANDRSPFTITRDASGRVTNVTYAGVDEAPEFELSEGSTVSPYSSGESNRAIVAMVNTLVELRDRLAANDKADLNQLNLDLGTHEDALLAARGENGTRLMRIEVARTQASDRDLSLQEADARAGGADLASVLVQLNQARNAYDAAMQSGAKLLQNSLLDYI